MNTFNFRDQRRVRLASALTALADQQSSASAKRDVLLADPNADPQQLQALEQKLADLAAWRTQLVAEQDVLAASDWQVSDRTYLAVAAEWIWATTLTLLEQVTTDPVLAVLGESPLLTPELAGNVETLPRGPGGPPSDFMHTVQETLAADQATFDELVLAGHRVWLSQPPEARTYPFDDMGVLLPLRLETLFDDTPEGERLSLRVVPDEVSICRDNPNLGEAEIASLQEFWQVVHDHLPDPAAPIHDWLETSHTQVAWDLLSRRVGVARAAWLASTFPPRLEKGAVVLDVPPDRIGPPAPNRVGGLPSQLEVWAVRQDGVGNEDRLHVGTLMAKDAEGEEARRRALVLELPDSVNALQNASWVSWETALSAGLGGEWILPAGWSHKTITALYVVGMSDEEPDTHFQAQADAGEMGLLRLGDPTNSVHGAQAASLAKDAATWRNVARMRLMARADPDAYLSHTPHLAPLGQTLLGDAAALPFVPGGSTDTAESQRLVRALWPALWGHYFRDLWGMDDRAHQLGLWAMDNLYPEGPLPPIRIDDQPYGLLPVTALSQWQPADNTADSVMERDMARQLVKLRTLWAEAACNAGTVIGADTKRLVEMLSRDALTAKYAYRNFLPTGLFARRYGINPADLRDRAAEDYRAAAEVMESELQRYYLTPGHLRHLNLPLIAPTRTMPEFPLQKLLGALLFDRRLTLELDSELVGELARTLPGGIDPGSQLGGVLHDVLHSEPLPPFDALFLEFMHGILPDSLLIRLLIQSLMLAQAWYMQSAEGTFQPLLNAPQWSEADPQFFPSVIQIWRRGFQQAFLNARGNDPVASLVNRQLDAMFDLATELSQPDRLREDEDPLNPGQPILRVEIPPERSAQLERAFRATLDTAAHRIDPWITGLAWRRLQQISTSQRRASRLGAYGWVDGPFLGQPGPTPAGRLHAPSHAQAITSIVLRDKFLSAGREGAQANGRNVWEMNLDSQLVRDALELAEEVQLGFHLYEVLGRRVEAIVGTHEKVKALRMNPQYAMHVPDPNVVCNGLVALTALLAGEANDLLSPNQDEQLQQLAQLRDLDSTLDAYGDLLVADAVHQVVTGHADTAAEVMDAAAGLSRPPTFESVRTPPSGYLLHTSVLSMLPWVEAAVDPGAHPLLIAEPSLAAYVDQQFPDLAGTIWQARGKRLDGDVESDIAGAVSLADLGLTVAEAALLPEDLLAGGVAAFLAIERLEEIASPVQVRVARQMMGALGGQPAIARTLVAEGELAGDEQTQLDAAVHDELAGRFATLVAACQDTAAALESAADDTARVAALRRALYWGVVPSVAPEEQRSLYRALFAGKLPADVTLLPRLAVAAANALGIQNEQGDVVGGRLAGAPAQVPQRIPELARALAELATADGKLSILGRWARADFQAKTCIQSNDVDDGLDEDWLTLLAPIRPNLARLEALQLQAGQPNMHQGLQPRTNSPGDPWQTAVVQENRRHREQGRPTDLSLQRFIAAYSAPRAWESDQVAVGLLDEFGESIPMPQRTTFVAFGFNAPAARPPQAILLAVPPKPRMHIDATLILDIVAETRELAHARAARVSDLGEYQSLAPGMWFHGSGPDRVRLDNSSQYWR